LINGFITSVIVFTILSFENTIFGKTDTRLLFW